MKTIDRRAAEFRALQESIIARLRNLDLTAMSDLSTALTVQEFRSLEFLASAEPRKTKDLAEYLGLAFNSVTDIVDALEHKGLARRQRDDVDRRVVRVELTRAGRDAADTVARGHLDIYRTYLSALTPQEQETLLALYRKIARAGQPEKARPRFS
ncbi:MAG TPA: MarR family winged helix-turn-helix transcriptional regulator [Gemmataceae bacterium]|nr:MarR family winged helix-turn-helix transcriptional regulator [Gemmataceae bacterium]